jgi:hypothetical protein
MSFSILEQCYSVVIHSFFLKNDNNGGTVSSNVNKSQLTVWLEKDNNKTQQMDRQYSLLEIC